MPKMDNLVLIPKNRQALGALPPPFEKVQGPSPIQQFWLMRMHAMLGQNETYIFCPPPLAKKHSVSLFYFPFIHEQIISC